jgi:hypothetical protein
LTGSGSIGISVDGRVEADHGDAYGRHFLSRGVFMAFTMPLLPDVGGNLRFGPPNEASAIPQHCYLLERII